MSLEEERKRIKLADKEREKYRENRLANVQEFYDEKLIAFQEKINQEQEVGKKDRLQSLYNDMASQIEIVQADDSFDVEEKKMLSDFARKTFEKRMNEISNG